MVDFKVVFSQLPIYTPPMISAIHKCDVEEYLDINHLPGSPDVLFSQNVGMESQFFVSITNRYPQNAYEHSFQHYKRTHLIAGTGFWTYLCAPISHVMVASDDNYLR